MTQPKPVLLLPGPGSAESARHFFGDAYDYVSYLTENYLVDTAAYITNGTLKPLAQRRVDFWQMPPRLAPAALKAGAESLLRQLLKLQCQLRIISFTDDDEQYEPMACRALELPKDAVLTWARAHIKPLELPPQTAPRETKPAKRGRPRSRPDGTPPQGNEIDGNTGSVFIPWERLGLECSSNGQPYPHLANVQKILANHPQIVGRIWYDEFHEKTFQTLFQPEPAEWSDTHDTRMTVWIQNNLRLSKVGHQIVQRAVDDYARQNPRNEVREWMDSLTWDHHERLPTLLQDAFGTAQNDYTAAVGRCWLVSMAARTYEPGCKVDTMPVFEGPQGIRKSTAMAILGGKWFAEMHEDITSKDFLQNLRGKLLIEISELHAFRKADILRIKGIISCSSDRYRASYGRRSEDHPRRSVWCGTTNEDNWVEDDTGARRLWPVACQSIDLEYLRRHREQLFAEAVYRFKAGEAWWDIDADLAKLEQDRRREPDQWADAVLQYCANRDSFTVSEILAQVIDLPLQDRGRSEQMRVASILRLAGFIKKDAWRDGRMVKLWLKCSKNV